MVGHILSVMHHIALRRRGEEIVHVACVAPCASAGLGKKTDGLARAHVREEPAPLQGLVIAKTPKHEIYFTKV